MWLIEQKHPPTSLKLDRPKTTRNKKSETRNLQEKGSTFAVKCFIRSVQAVQSVFSFYPVSGGLNHEKQ